MPLIQGKKFCITGTLSSMKRAEAEVSTSFVLTRALMCSFAAFLSQVQIIKAGGSVVRKPNKNVDIVVCGESAGSKLALAEVLGTSCA